MVNQMKTHNIVARDLDEAHFLAVLKCFEVGRLYTIDRGSFEGHRRLEVPYVTIEINHPWNRPLAPEVPPSVPRPTSDDEIRNYFFENLMDMDPGNYQYTYGQYIMPQLQKCIDMLKADPMTNQACITIGGQESIDQESPPCLRLIDCRVDQDGLLHFIVYFRSWDCWAGLPQNLGGLQLLKEYMLLNLEGVEDGKIIASSKGLHLYDYQWRIALQRTHGYLPEGSQITLEDIHKGERR